MRWLSVLMYLAICVTAGGLGACGDDVPVPPRSLSSPSGVSHARSCVVELNGVDTRVLTERCQEGGDLEGQGRLTTLGLVSNRERQTLVLMTLDDPVPVLIDTDRGVPGVTGITICRGGSDVGATPDGNFAVVLCEIDQAFAIVDLVNVREALRVPRFDVEVAMDDFPDEPLFATAQPESRQIVIERLAYDCDGETEIFPRGCDPGVTFEVEAMVATPGRPRDVAAAPEGRFFVVYQDRAYASQFELYDGATCLADGEAPPCEVARFGLTRECRDGLDNDGDGLIDHADRQCFGPNGAESPDGMRGRLTQCTDGVDNDGDGAVDHDDVGCLAAIDDNEGGGVLPIACSDGVDNDGDGFVDADDPECASPGWTSEAFAPACADGVDNDGDGAIDFPDDPECPDALWLSEARAPACADGVDNDLDGATDFPDDADCLSLLTDAFETPQAACNNGIDDDGDGFIDRADPGCSSPRDESELGPDPVCADGADNDEDGLTDLADPDCFGAAGANENPVINGDLGPIGLDDDGNYLLVADNLGAQIMIVDLTSGRLIDAGEDDYIHPDLGVPVSNGGVVARSRAYEIVSRNELDDGRVNAFADQIGIVPVSDGFGVVLDLVSVASSTPPDGDPVEGTMERFRPRDALSTVADSGGFECELPDDYRQAVRETRPPEGSDRVTCSDPEVPKLRPLDVEGQPDDEGERVLFVSETRFTFEDDAFIQTETSIDWRLRDENWFLVYEGTLPDSTRLDGIVDEDYDGLVVSAGVNYCGLGVEPGDRLVIEASLPALDAQPEDCVAFQEVNLEYLVEYVRSDGLYLGLTGDEGDATALPNRTCFGLGFAYFIRAGEDWLLRGSVSGYIHDQTTLSQQCVPLTGDPRRSGRPLENVLFENVYYDFLLDGGAVPATRGLVIAFGVENNFASVVLDTGPTPLDIDLAATAQGRRLLISDGGVSAIFVFEASTLFAISSVI